MSTREEFDLEAALRDPSAAFATPRAVVEDPRLDRRDKLRILKRWESDARALAVAEDENMAGGEGTMLEQVLEAEKALQSESGSDTPGSTETG